MKDEFNTSERGNALTNTATPSPPTLTVDVEKYQAFLDGADMTEVQKEEFLQALWSIIVSFVDLGFGVHPLQAVCGENADYDSKAAKSEFDVVSCDDQENDEKPNDISP
ncbi:MAG: hypothetical protein P8N14_03015 [Sulfitobacter sp.]|nr:hypothetical protein [Sulfitobacter sp.]